MAFVEKRLPDGIAFGASFGPEYQTNVVVVNSGHESRNINWAKARLVANIGYQNKTEADTAALIAWFRSVKGRAHGFRVRDWSDYQASASTGVLKHLGGLMYQLQKQYEIDALSELRDITKPVAETVAVFDEQGAQLLGELDETNGSFVLTEGQEAPAYWTGEFDVPVRFDVDKLELSVANRSSQGLVYSWPSIPLIELRVAPALYTNGNHEA